MRLQIAIKFACKCYSKQEKVMKLYENFIANLFKARKGFMMKEYDSIISEKYGR